MHQFWRGVSSLWVAARILLKTPGLKRHALLPFLVNVVVFSAVFSLVIFLILPGIHLDRWSPSWAGRWGPSVLSLLKWILGLVLYMVALVYGFTAIGLIVAGPFNDLLSERVEKALCASEANPRLPFRETLQQITATLLSSLSILFWQAFCTLLALPFLLIPVIGAIPLLAANAYFQGWGFMAVPLSRHFLKGRHRKAGLRDHRWEIFGLGIGMTLLLGIPLIDLFVLPLGVTAATWIYCRVDWKEKLSAAQVPAPPGFEPPVISPSVSPS